MRVDPLHPQSFIGRDLLELGDDHRTTTVQLRDALSQAANEDIRERFGLWII